MSFTEVLPYLPRCSARYCWMRLSSVRDIGFLHYRGSHRIDSSYVIASKEAFISRSASQMSRVFQNTDFALTDAESCFVDLRQNFSSAFFQGVLLGFPSLWIALHHESHGNKQSGILPRPYNGGNCQPAGVLCLFPAQLRKRVTIHRAPSTEHQFCFTDAGSCFAGFGRSFASLASNPRPAPNR